jgi:hypothetical protein
LNFPAAISCKTVVVHHTPTGGSSVVVAISVPWPYGYGLRPYGVDRPSLSWLRVGVHERAKIDNSGEGVGYFNMVSYGTTLFKALGIVINFFNQEKSELYVELIVCTGSLN